METEKQKLKCNIINMCNGAIEERINVEMENIVENILNLNTEAKKKRTLTITLDLVPSDDRSTVAVAAQVKSKLQPLSSVPTMLYVGTDSNGQLSAVEAIAQTPGQMNFDGSCQTEEKVIKLGAKQA